MSLLIVQVKTVKTSPFELGWWGWSQPFSSGPGIFLYKMLGLSLQGGSAWKLCLKSGEKTLSQKIQLWDCATIVSSQMGLQNDFWLCWYPLFDCKQRAYKKVSKYKMGVTIKWKKVPAYKVWASAPKLSIKSYPKRHSFSHKACHSVVEIGTPMLFLHSTFWLRHEMCFAPQRRALFEHLNYQKCSEPASFYHFWLWNVLGTTTPGTFSSSQLPKVVRNWKAFSTFWFRHVLRVTTPCTFSTTSTSKSAPKPTVFTTSDFEMCFAPQRPALFHYLNFQKCSEHVVFLRLLTSKCASRQNCVHFFNVWTSKSGAELNLFMLFLHVDFDMCFAQQRPALFHYLNFQKCSEHVVFLPLLTSKCASRHSCVHFFNVWTPKSGPELKFFLHFDFEMCFAPQRCALFEHLNYQKWSEPTSFYNFWLGNVLRATTPSTFSSSQLPSVPNMWCFYCFWLRDVRHATKARAEPTFRSSGVRSHKALENHSVSRLVYLFAHLHLLSSDSFSSLTLPISAFPYVHIVGSLTSKLPSVLVNGCWSTKSLQVDTFQLPAPWQLARCWRDLTSDPKDHPGDLGRYRPTRFGHTAAV